MSTSFGSLVDELENIIVKFKKINQFFEQTRITDVDAFVTHSEDIMTHIKYIENKIEILQQEKENLLQNYRSLEQKNINLEIANNALKKELNMDLVSKNKRLISVAQKLDSEYKKLKQENEKQKHNNTILLKNEQIMNSTFKDLLKISDDSIALNTTFNILVESFENINSIISAMIRRGGEINIVDETTTQGTNIDTIQNMTIQEKLVKLESIFENLSSNPFLLEG